MDQSNLMYRSIKSLLHHKKKIIHKFPLLYKFFSKNNSKKYYNNKQKNLNFNNKKKQI